jgi:hypothetical protein
MSNLRDTYINNNLNVSSGVMIDNKIINNDIIYPIITVGGEESSRTITVNLRKFNSQLSINGRPKIHWWISSTKWSYPIAIGGIHNIVVTNGVKLDPTTDVTTATLRTCLADSNSNLVVTVSSSGASGTYYFMCSVQGIVYSVSFTISIA